MTASQHFFLLVSHARPCLIMMVSCCTQVSPDQMYHLDAVIYGLIVLLNMMPGKAYLGVYLNSGGAIHALKLLIDKDYAAFKSEFAEASTASVYSLGPGPGRPQRLVEAMQGRSDQEKLDMAWGLYARRKLTEQGFESLWERAYLELDEFEMVLASMALCHFGAQYPCFSRQEPIPSDWWHLRLHLYVGNKLVRSNQVVLVDAVEREMKKHNVVEEPVASTTINLFNPPAHMRGLLAALPLLMPVKV